MAVTVSINYPSDNYITNNNAQPISFTVTDSDGGLITGELSYNDGGTKTRNGARAQPSGTTFVLPFYDSTADGTWDWEVWGALDPTGSGALYNPVYAPTRTITIDTVNPRKPTCTIGSVTSTSVRIYSDSFSDPSPSSGYGSRTAYMDRWTGSSWTSFGTKTFSFSSTQYVDYTGMDPATQYRVRLRHTDKAGNYTYSDYVAITLNSAPAAPTIAAPSSSGSTFNNRPKVIANVPVDVDGNTVKVQAVFKSGATEICTVESAYVTQGTGTVTLTPTADLPPGTITVELSAHDGSVWSTVNAYAFTVVTVPAFPVLATDTGIRAAYLNNLTEWINNARQFRGLAAFSFTDGAVLANSTQIKAIHLAERRTKLAEVLSPVGVTPSWTDETITANLTQRKGIHWLEVFNYLKQI